MPFVMPDIPIWVYAIIAVLVIIVLYVVYKKLTAYKPSSKSFQQNETALPDNFDANAEAENAFNILDSWFGTDDQTLFQHLNSMTDNELTATYNAYNQNHYSDHNTSLTGRIADVKSFFTTSTGALRDQLVQRMQNIQLT